MGRNMARETDLARLERELDNLSAMDLSAMGYEAKVRHHGRVERARQEHLRALECVEEASASPDRPQGESPPHADLEQTTSV